VSQLHHHRTCTARAQEKADLLCFASSPPEFRVPGDWTGQAENASRRCYYPGKMERTATLFLVIRKADVANWRRRYEAALTRKAFLSAADEGPALGASGTETAECCGSSCTWKRNSWIAGESVNAAYPARSSSQVPTAVRFTIYTGLRRSSCARDQVWRPGQNAAPSGSTDGGRHRRPARQ
jgi:hypothetical protein